jgi:prefoldin subunit 5
LQLDSYNKFQEIAEEKQKLESEIKKLQQEKEELVQLRNVELNRALAKVENLISLSFFFFFSVLNEN